MDGIIGRAGLSNSMKDGAGSRLLKAGAGWGKVKSKMSLSEVNANLKTSEVEFRKMVLRVSNKSEATIDLMEKRMKKKEVVREKTEFELMKERLKHVEFSDEEKGFLTKEQMDIVSNKVGEAKKLLTDIEREGKGKGKLLKSYIEDYEEWAQELQYLKDSGLDIDMDGLLQARKRIIIKDLFFDPEKAEEKAIVEQVAMEEVKERELVLVKKRQLADVERMEILKSEKSRMQKEGEVKEKKAREEVEAKIAYHVEEDEKLKKYAEQERGKLQLDEVKRQEAGEENKAKREGLLRKFSTTENPESLEIDVSDTSKQMRRRSMGVQDNPFENQGQSGVNKNQGQSGVNKPRSRRESRVGKLNMPFDNSAVSETPTSWSKASSRSASRSSSRRNSHVSETMSESETMSVIDKPDFIEALAGLQDLAFRAGEYDED